jgi:chromate transporter
MEGEMERETTGAAAGGERGGSFWEVLAVFTRLGLTSFGGPVAHLGYFRTELVERRRWLDDRSYADLVALCQFLPGPASSQTGIALGLLRAGMPGALAAWLGFTMPSAAIMIAFAYGVALLGGGAEAGWLHGLKVVAVAVVAQAVWGMARTLAPDRPRATIALATAAALLVWPSALAQVGLIALGGAVGWRLLKPKPAEEAPAARFDVPQPLAVACWALFFGLLAGLPLLRQVWPAHGLALFDSFYRAGALVFGGGHVVLPLLEAEVVPPGWVARDSFIAGYGAAQALPGPLFTFAAYLGAASGPAPSGVAGGLLALVAIFLPAWLLVIGALPYWERLRALPAAQATLSGVNAAVVGVLLAALYDPVWTSAIVTPLDLALALLCFGLLVVWKAPPWAVVALAALAGALIPA